MKHELIMAYLKHTDHWIAGVEDAKIDYVRHGAGCCHIHFKYSSGYHNEDVTIETLDLLAFIWSSPKAREITNE